MIQPILSPCDIGQWTTEKVLSVIAIIVAVISGIILPLIINKKKEKRKQQDEEEEKRMQLKELLKQKEEETRKWCERGKNELRYRPDKDKELYYIQPYIKEVIPIGNKGEERNGEKILLKDFFLDKEKRGILLKSSDDTYHTAFCILGDTGSGKTTALHYLYIDYIDHITNMILDQITKMRDQITKMNLDQITEMRDQITKMNLPHIYFHYMSEDDVFDQINKIENQRECILLLDAIDENHMAQDPNTREQFMEKIGLVYKNFGFVVTTCRPQFYATLQEENEKVRIGGKHHWLDVKRLRLQAFDNDQVNNYLHHVYSTDLQSFLKAKNFVDIIVSKDFKVEFRPLMLYYIEDFVNKNPEINNNLDLYDFIVKEQISRDIDAFSPTTEKLIQPWWNMTSDVAYYLYSNHKDHLTAEELKNIISKHNENEITEWKEKIQSIIIALSSNQIPSHLFQQRSLLTRTGNEFHFSHRSIYEYFMAYRFLLHPNEIMYVNGMNFALKLFDELCDAYKQNKSNTFTNNFSKVSHNYIISLMKIGEELHAIKHFNQSKLMYINAFDYYYQTGDKSMCRTLAMLLPKWFPEDATIITLLLSHGFSKCIGDER